MNFPGYPSPSYGGYTPAAYIYAPAPAKPTSGTSAVMCTHWPEWQTAMMVAQKCMASLSMCECRMGMGVFVKDDELLIPKHLINGTSDKQICGSSLDELVRRIRIDYNDDQICYPTVNVEHILEDGYEKDYCLLKLTSKLPCSVPQITFNRHHTQCLFAELLEGGEFRFSIVSPCSMSQELMCNSVLDWTRPGSCGGIYLDRCGQLIAIHLSQATGLCDEHTGRERKFLFAHEIMRDSSRLSTIDRAFNPIKKPLCLSPIFPDPCFTLQADVKDSTKRNKEGYYCNYQEVHITHAERGAQIELKRHDMSIYCVRYKFYLMNGSTRQPNIHNEIYKKNVVAFYKTFAETFRDELSHSTKENLPRSFIYPFKKCDFYAEMTD